MTDASSQLKESATYCKPNDPKRPGLVGLPDATTSQVCPDDGSAVDELTNAYPDGWYVRIMFDELLDPSVETLTEVLDENGMGTDTFTGSIATTHPVKLECQSVAGGMVNVDYDGYYSPAGNAVTWPLGPSLVIKPNSPTLIATNKECQVTINDNVTDKDGNQVPSGDRMPFKFKLAPIEVTSIDPPDDPDFESPIPATQIFFDNPFIEFNTTVDFDSLCPDADANGLCDDESVFSIKDVAHPAEGPGYCNVTGATCGSIADCDTTGGDTLCGRGFCKNNAPCNVAADCTGANPHCGTVYAYDYVPFGGTDKQFGIGPPEPVETEHKYIMSFTAGAKLKDRCGGETTLPMPTADNLMLAHFVTDKFDFAKASIANGETASAMKRLEYSFTNVVEGSDFPGDYTAISGALTTTGGSPEFTISPLPKVMTGPCTSTSCPLADIAPSDLMIVASDASGQIQLQGHYQLNTEYTATIKAGAVVKDFYGKMWTNTSDQVIKWKTQPAIALTGIGVRPPGSLVTIADGGTVVKPAASSALSIRLGFNSSMDPATLDVSDVKVEAVGTSPAPPTLTLSAPSGCGYWETTGPNDPSLGDNSTGWIGACTLRLSGVFQKGDYKITVKAGAQFKDIFGVSYTQAADQSITITVDEAAPVAPCL